MKLRASFFIVIAAFLSLQFKAKAALPAPITLAWNASSNAATYTLYWGSQSGNYTSSQSCPASQTNLTVTIFTNQVYYFAVTAKSAGGSESPKSSEIVYNPPLPTVPPAVPSGLAVSGPPTGGPTASASWNSANNATGYELYWGTASGQYTLSNSCAAPQTSLNVTGLLTNQTYYFAVAALGSNAQSALSSPVAYSNALAVVPPAVPSGLAVSGPSGGGATASAAWNSVSNASGYELYWGTSSGHYTASNNCAAPQTSQNVTGLLTNQTYYFAIAALGSNTQSALSSPVAYANALAPTNTPPLPTPGNFTETAVTNNGIAGLALSWSSVANAVGYGLDWGTNTGVYAWSSNCLSSQTEATLTNLIGGETYYFAVKALSSGGSNDSAFSTELVYTNPMGMPLNFTVSSASGTTVASWAPVADAAGYAVFYGTQSGVYVTNASCGGGQTSLSVTNLTANNVYYFAAAARATNGSQGPYSAEVIFTNTVATNSGGGQPPPNTSPGSLAPLAARVVPGTVPNAAIVTWGPQANNGTYVLYEWPGTLANYQNNSSSSAVSTQPSTEVTGLTANQSYVFAVYAVDANTWGTPVAYTNSANVIPPPTDLAVSFTSAGAAAAWSPVANAAGYSLFYGVQSGVYLTSAACGSAQTSMLVTNLASSNVYYFAVSALDGNGNPGPYSAEVTFTNTASVATVEVPPLAATVTPGSAPDTAIVSWAVEPNVSTYVLFQWPGTLASYQNNNSTSTVATQTNATVAGLTPGQTYVFVVYAVDDSTWGAPVAYINPLPPPPPVPGGFAVSAGAATNSATAKWNLVAGAGGYELYWGTSSGNYTFSNSLAVSEIGMTVSNLATNQSYYFAVASVGANGTESALSAELSYFNAAPITPAFAPSTNQVPGIPPMVALSVFNQQPNLVISGTVGAQMKIQATTNIADPTAWTTVDTITLTNAATNLDTGPSNALPAIVAAAFAPAAQVYVPGISTGTAAQAYRVSMPYDYATLAYQVLPMTNYPTRLIGVYMPGLNDNVCYVTNEYNYIYCDPLTFNVDVQSSGPAIRQIATSLAGALNQSWTSAVELAYTNGGYQLLATVVETDAPSSDQVAGQQSASSIQINF